VGIGVVNIYLRCFLNRLLAGILDYVRQLYYLYIIVFVEDYIWSRVSLDVMGPYVGLFVIRSAGR
jgi:hypothetical protein